MDIHEIENLSFIGLKANRTELVEAAKVFPQGELAERYIQARTDAKHRDEKLAEQGRTISALHEALAVAKEKGEAAQAAEKQCRKAVDAHAAAERGAGKVIDEMGEKLSMSNRRCDRLKTQAEKYAAAMTTIHKAATDAISSRDITQADEGE